MLTWKSGHEVLTPLPSRVPHPPTPCSCPTRSVIGCPLNRLCDSHCVPISAILVYDGVVFAHGEMIILNEQRKQNIHA